MRTLSGSGISFVTATQIAVGEDLLVEVRGAQPNAPILRAEMKVLRVDETGEGHCVAGTFVDRVTNPAS